MTPAPESMPPAWGELLTRLRDGDRSTALSLQAVVKATAASGQASLHDIAVAELGVRRAARPDSDGDAGRLDEIREHLARTALPRLQDLGAVVPVFEPPHEEPVSWRLAPVLVEALQRDAGAVDSALRTTSEHAAPRKPALARVEGSSVLRAEGLVKTYKRRNVVNRVDVEVRQGEIVGLLGPNGAGKTTTFYMIVGLIPPNAGRILFDGDDITTTPMYRRARRGIGYLSQEPSIFRKLTVEENILAILETLPLARPERDARLESLLDELGIKHLRRNKAYSLSGGERRRLEITRALVTQPKFMLLDEPFAGVDPIAVHDIQQIVASLKDRGIGVLITDHNVEQTLDIVDRAYIVFDGQIKVSGTVRDLVFDDEVAHIYLGPTLTARLRTRFRAEHGPPA
ncbi:MAG TPA: LPS export ABC transporter ATP-binding protein [Gemmatimonadaceae bacterium]|nr:LPS export ABC transporter ATP-binding protein [Gemmatimonadaceae bacterium]